MGTEPLLVPAPSPPSLSCSLLTLGSASLQMKIPSDQLLNVKTMNDYCMCAFYKMKELVYSPWLWKISVDLVDVSVPAVVVVVLLGLFLNLE